MDIESVDQGWDIVYTAKEEKEESWKWILKDHVHMLIHYHVLWKKRKNPENGYWKLENPCF